MRELSPPPLSHGIIATFYARKILQVPDAFSVAPAQNELI
jgi:hypothetical protein